MVSLKISNRHRRDRGNPSPVTIGVCGLGPNTGVTCICIALCNYLCSKEKKDTAYVELNATREIRYLYKSQFQAEHCGAFNQTGILMYPESTLSDIPDILSKHHEYLIMDFGVLVPHVYAEFLRCSIRLIVCDLSPWKQNRLSSQFHLLKDLLHHQENHILFLVNSGKYQNPKEILRKWSDLPTSKIHILETPYLPNPFQLTSDSFEFFKNLLKGEYNTTT